MVMSLLATACSGGAGPGDQEPAEVVQGQEGLEEDSVKDPSEKDSQTEPPKEEEDQVKPSTDPETMEESEDTDPNSEPVEAEEPEEQPEPESEEQPESETEEQPESEPEEAQVVQEGPLLKVEGKVSTQLSLDLSQLKSMDSLVYSADYYWLNSFGSTGHTSFKGVRLWGLLSEKAGLGSDAQTVRIVATDGYEMTFTVDQIKKQDYIDETDESKKLPVIVAWQEDGTQYDPDKGPPYKLVMGQKQAGDVNKPQWVSNIDRIIVE